MASIFTRSMTIGKHQVFFLMLDTCGSWVMVFRGQCDLQGYSQTFPVSSSSLSGADLHAHILMVQNVVLACYSAHLGPWTRRHLLPEVSGSLPPPSVRESSSIDSFGTSMGSHSSQLLTVLQVFSFFSRHLCPSVNSLYLSKNRALEHLRVGPPFSWT